MLNSYSEKSCLSHQPWGEFSLSGNCTSAAYMATSVYSTSELFSWKIIIEVERSMDTTEDLLGLYMYKT